MSGFLEQNVHDVTSGLSARQGEWDGYGVRSQQRFENAPELAIVYHSPHKDTPWHTALMACLGPLEGRSILEVGCATGLFATYLAKHGASVFGGDIAFEAIKAAQQRAQINGVTGKFLQLNLAHPLPFTNDSLDLVVGVAVLHHLARPDVLNTLSEAYRVLRKGGKAVFVEPVENSVLFNFVQNLLPSGNRSSPFYRPSCLSRRAYLRYQEKADDRSLTSRELMEAGQKFKNVRLRPFGLSSRVEGLFELVGIRASFIRRLLQEVDSLTLKTCAPTRRFCRSVLAEYVK